MVFPDNIEIKYKEKQKKEINSSIGDNLIPKNIIGLMPSIILSPDFKSITFGAPQDRRDFIDRILSQSSKLYLEELIKYRKVLKQRNNLLSQAKTDRYFDTSFLEPWTELLVDTAVDIIHKRNSLIKKFLPYFKSYYCYISSNKEDVELQYLNPYIFQLNFDRDDKKVIRHQLVLAARDKYKAEFKRGITLFGPHKDELEIRINGGIARETASQGQHKSLLISLKLAEFHYLKDRKNEIPITLLDDIFSELDSERAAKVLEILTENSAQTFITLTDCDALNKILPDNIDKKYFYVEDGGVS